MDHVESKRSHTTNMSNLSRKLFLSYESWRLYDLAWAAAENSTADVTVEARDGAMLGCASMCNDGTKICVLMKAKGSQSRVTAM